MAHTHLRTTGPSRTPAEFVLANAAAFLAGFDASTPEGVVFCPTRRKLPNGSPVTVRVRMGRRKPPSLLLGRVAWRRPGRHLDKVRAGIAVELLSSERTKRDYLIAMATAKDTIASRRRHERLPVNIPVCIHIVGSDTEVQARLLDVGRGGASLRSSKSVPGNTDVILEVSPPGAQIAMEFSARVAWSRPAAADEIGIGLEWRSRDAGGAKRIRELVRRLSQML